MRRLLWPLVPVYAAAQALNEAAYTRGWRHAQRLTGPVVSIGNLSVGGSGKTPFTITLAHALRQRGWPVSVLSRGYGRQSELAERVDPARPEAASWYGDEPTLIARTGVPVFVARRRVEAGRMAEAALSPQHPVHLLDDGMQHRALARDVEIVLLHRSDFDTVLLPAGRLREPLAALGRADFVVMREEDRDLESRAWRWMRRNATIWTVRRELEIPPLPGPAMVLSAIARPQEFAGDLCSARVVIAGERAWRDHHAWTDEDIAQLRAQAVANGAACFVTTAKDAVRLTLDQQARLEETAPLQVVELRVRLLDADVALDALEARLPGRARRVRESAIGNADKSSE